LIRVAIFLVLFAPDSCLQMLDEGAAKGDPNAGKTPALDTPPIELPNGGSTQNACDRTTAQARDILGRYCGPCHGGATPDAHRGCPPFDFVLDFQRLTMTRSETAKDPRDPSQGMVFVIPGDPEYSRVYQRVADDEMPPKSVDPKSRPNFSDISVLYTWIKNCVGQ
jgi:hypothetical protein